MSPSSKESIQRPTTLNDQLDILFIRVPTVSIGLSVVVGTVRVGVLLLQHMCFNDQIQLAQQILGLLRTRQFDR